MVHLDSTWSSCELHVDYGHKFGRATTKVKCTWSPGGLQKIHLDSGGVHLEKVGQGKVLNEPTIHRYALALISDILLIKLTKFHRHVNN